jgi:hypothetical protein
MDKNCREINERIVFHNRAPLAPPTVCFTLYFFMGFAANVLSDVKQGT